MELCLGTVQFGMDYGVFNQPKKDVDYCVDCLDYATQNGINAIDTATAYGIAEEVVGKFIRKNTINRNKLFISSKLLPNILDDYEKEDYEKVILDNIKKQLSVLGTDYLDAYFLHSSRYIHNPEILEALQIVKHEGLAKDVGVSIYYEDEAKVAFGNKNVQYVQAPYSIFDHRMKKVGLFDKTKIGEMKVDTRTTFIKGLIRLSDSEIPEHLEKARPILRKLDEICNETGYNRIQLAIGYVKQQEVINHLVFGVRDLEQLKQDIEAFELDIPSDIFTKMDEEFKNIDTDIVVPSLWKR
ncbi:Predicted oxidoreductase [Pseudobutyrivibrio sp. YE44]|uniref:aldo/keto reductase n=1 Tax=Pseudobutyrivibrio sp. YE44 TaxID=1520802 RepID=UPI000891D063|nr:aldo/keto reductase [Pseudobutyrivibrio sp. YE44]SDB54134.1 Predicted oxidoreductase [Pseudobutyrivibrio sp. YE44]